MNEAECEAASRPRWRAMPLPGDGASVISRIHHLNRPPDPAHRRCSRRSRKRKSAFGSRLRDNVTKLPMQTRREFTLITHSLATNVHMVMRLHGGNIATPEIFSKKNKNKTSGERCLPTGAPRMPPECLRVPPEYNLTA